MLDGVVCVQSKFHEPRYSHGKTSRPLGPIVTAYKSHLDITVHLAPDPTLGRGEGPRLLSVTRYGSDPRDPGGIRSKLRGMLFPPCLEIATDG